MKYLIEIIIFYMIEYLYKPSKNIKGRQQDQTNNIFLCKIFMQSRNLIDFNPLLPKQIVIAQNKPNLL